MIRLGNLASTDISNKSWFVQAVYGGGLLLLLSAVNGIFPVINLRTTPGIAWFPIPMVVVAICALLLCQRAGGSTLRAKTESQLAPLTRYGLVVLSVLLLTAAAMVLTGLDAVRLGRATLYGDLLPASGIFRNIYSITLGITEALTEEASVRGIIQVPLTAKLGSFRAQTIAGAVFVVVHLFARSGWSEFAFVGLLAMTCGILTSATRGIWAPAFVHALTNTIVTTVVLVYRTY